MRHLLLILALASCGPIDPGPVVDEDGNEVIEPGPFDDYLVATPLYDEVVGVRPVLRWQMSAYLDEDALLDFSAVSVASAGIAASGRVKFRMSDRILEFRPFSDLEPGLRYRPSFNPDVLFSITGAPFAPASQPTFVVDEEVVTDDPAIPAVSWATIDGILEAKCRSCHADPQWQLNPLTRDSMIGARSDQADATIVIPYDPGDSYLLHKILPSFPTRKYSVQPPPWSGAVALSDTEVAQFERWILNGAQNVRLASPRASR